MLYKSKGLRRRSETKWQARLVHEDPVTKERLITYHTVEGKTQRQAERARGELIFELESKGGAFGSAMSLREFLEKFVDYKEASGTIEASTVSGYRCETRQICRYIGDMELRDLTIDAVNGWMAEMTRDGYAPKTVTKPFRLLKQALNYAVAQDLLRKNPCDFCKPPKRVKTPINALPRAERTRMMKMARAAQPDRLGIAIEIALTTGMRRSEVCALRWSDLGDDQTISVTHTLGDADGKFYEKEPKTSESARTIPLTQHTYLMLKDMRDEAAYMLRRLGVKNADPYILGTLEVQSRPYNPDVLSKDFSAFCRMNGFKCTFNDLRHTFATMMIGSGVDVRTVASYLGHTSVSMTLNIYADVDPDAKRGAVDNDDHLEGASDMVGQACALYGSTSETGSVLSTRNAGPVYSEQGWLMLSDSFTDLKPVPSMAWFDAGLQALIGSDDYVETWRIWDCYEQGWADIALEMHRFEMFDLVIRRDGYYACSWRGAVDTRGRVLASLDPEENEAKCWQWLRADTQ